MNKNFLLVICLLVLTLGCGKILRYPSNAYLVRQSVEQSVKNIPGTREGKITIVDLNAESNNADDEPINSMVQDALITGLVSKGYSVVERDKELLGKIAREINGFKYNLSASLISHQVTNPVPTKETITITTQDGNTKTEKIELKGENKILEQESTINSEIKLDIQKSGEILGVDRLLAYRILELGLRYDKGSTGKMKKRIAETQLSLRLIDTNTSKILWAGMGEGNVSDEIPRRAIKQVEKNDLELFSFTMPNLKTKESNVDIKKQNIRDYNLSVVWQISHFSNEK
ncbi:MAG: CsgG/HfaB family protein [Elusimicrobiota bacterium]